MNKFSIMVACLAFVSSCFAQDKTAVQYKNEGQEYMKEKKYQQALESYKECLKLQGDSVDAVVCFNAGYCAQSVKEYDTAYEYFTKAEEMEYKKAMSAYYKTQILKAQGKTEEYEAAVEVGFNSYKNGQTGVAFKKEYAKIYRDKAYAKYNEGVEITKGFASAKSDQLDGLKKNALEKFEEASPLIEKSLEINADDANAKNIKDGIDKQIATLK